MCGGARDLDGDSVLHVHLERARVRAVVRARALDDGHRRCCRRVARRVASADHAANPVSRMRSMNLSHCASCSSATNSFGRWACAISPGPHMTLGTPIFWNSPASVPYDTLPAWLFLDSCIAQRTMASD